MRFTVAGHASLHIEARGHSLLLDPWLWGSCYWRSWWHYPPCEPRPEWLAPDFIYLSHYHFDHFHYPSMRRLDKRATVLMPRFGVDVMPREVKGLGFERVIELPHGDVVEIAPGLRVASFQYGFDDSALLVHDGETVLCDVNDSKVRGRSLAELREAFGPPTFLFKSHSFAIAYPLCYEAEDPEELALVTRETFPEDFIEVSHGLQPRWAVPFASSVAFLHPEAVRHNREQVTPVEVARVFRKDARVAKSEIVCLAPGDGWSSETGFEIADVDWYGERDERLARLEVLHRPQIERSLADEAATALCFEDFEAYLLRFMDVLPPGVARGLLGRPLVFEVPSSPEPYWVVDFRRRRVLRSLQLPEGWASVTSIAEGVLADAIGKHLLSFINGAMRSRTRLAPGGVSIDLAFWGLVIIWETGYLPLSKVVWTRRFWSALWRRRREWLDQLAALRGGGDGAGGSVLRRLSRGFASSKVGVES
jgi:UDP-MurNAc hydroxylase